MDVAVCGLVFLESGGVGGREFKNVYRPIFVESGVTGRSAEFAKGRFKAVCSIVFAESGGAGGNAEFAK